MAHLIDKDALVAEITHKIKVFEAFIKNFDGISDKVEKAKNKIEALGDALLFIENLEVKEVDLEKEAELIANGIMISVQANKYNTVVYNVKRNDFNHSHLMLAARKGIELGLSVNNPITASDRCMAEEIIINLKRVEQDYHINLTKEMEWLRNQVKKGE